MTVDEYLKLQEANKKIYELARNEEERKLFLAKMMEAEVQFIKDNVTPFSRCKMRPVKVDDARLDQPLHATLSTNDKTDPFPESDTVVDMVGKVTPENFFESLSFKDSTGKEFDLKEVFKEQPQELRRLCNLINRSVKAQLIEQYGNRDDLQMFEDREHIGFKRKPESIKNPETEVGNIMGRAHKLAASQQENLADSQQDTPALEEDLSQKASLN